MSIKCSNNDFCDTEKHLKRSSEQHPSLILENPEVSHAGKAGKCLRCEHLCIPPCPSVGGPSVRGDQGWDHLHWRSSWEHVHSLHHDRSLYSNSSLVKKYSHVCRSFPGLWVAVNLKENSWKGIITNTWDLVLSSSRTRVVPEPSTFVASNSTLRIKLW